MFLQFTIKVHIEIGQTGLTPRLTVVRVFAMYICHRDCLNVLSCILMCVCVRSHVHVCVFFLSSKLPIVLVKISSSVKLKTSLQRYNIYEIMVARLK